MSDVQQMLMRKVKVNDSLYKYVILNNFKKNLQATFLVFETFGDDGDGDATKKYFPVDDD